jgi:hypothetical protein
MNMHAYHTVDFCEILRHSKNSTNSLQILVIIMSRSLMPISNKLRYPAWGYTVRF